jgi:hypothetical protein
MSVKKSIFDKAILLANENHNEYSYSLPITEVKVTNQHRYSEELEITIKTTRFKRKKVKEQ